MQGAEKEKKCSLSSTPLWILIKENFARKIEEPQGWRLVIADLDKSHQAEGGPGTLEQPRSAAGTGRGSGAAPVPGGSDDQLAPAPQLQWRDVASAENCLGFKRKDVLSLI